MALKHISQLCNVGCQELTEQRHSGSNPDYGLPTPTLVSPPKVSCDWRIPGHVTAVLTLIGPGPQELGRWQAGRHRSLQPGDRAAEAVPLRLCRAAHDGGGQEEGGAVLQRLHQGGAGESCFILPIRNK